jgi:hypothetical protein
MDPQVNEARPCHAQKFYRKGIHDTLIAGRFSAGYEAAMKRWNDLK